MSLPTISISSTTSFGARIRMEQITREGIEGISAVDVRFADRFGYVIKLLATGRSLPGGALDLRVHPAMIRKSSLLAGIGGALGALRYTPSAGAAVQRHAVHQLHLVGRQQRRQTADLGGLGVGVVQPLHIGAEAGLAAQVQRQVHAQAAVHRQGVDQVAEGRAPGQCEIVAARIAQRRHRPAQRTPVSNFFLAGSYTRQDYIDSMEGATMSGRLAAAARWCECRWRRKSATARDSASTLSYRSLGLRAVVHRHLDGQREVPIDSPLIHTDLNTPAAYAAARNAR